jgi:hypothetical protein
MNTYQDHGSYITGPLGTIPKEHRLYQEILKEVEANQSKIIQFVEPTPTPEEKCASELCQQGVKTETMVEALWKRIVRGEVTATDVIEAKRQSIEEKFKK